MSQNATARRGRPRDGAVDQRVLTAAWDLLHAGGYAALNMDEVAVRAGFGTGLNLRTHFRRRLDTTPTTYRRNFRAPANATRREAV